MTSATRVRPPRIKRIKVKKSPFLIGATVIGAIATALILYPIVRVAITLFGPETDSDVLASTLAMPGLGQTLLNTMTLVVVAGGLSLTVGFVLAWLNERTDARMGFLTDILPIVPLLVPPMAAVIGWVFLLSPKSGIINVAIRNLFGVDADSGPFDVYSYPVIVALYTIEMVPIVYLVISGAFRNLNPDLEQASTTSGAGPLRTLFHVTIPAMKPALAAAGWMCVVGGLVIFSIPAVVGTPAGFKVLSTEIVSLLTAFYPAKTSQVALLGVFMLVVIGIAGLIRWLMVRSGHYAKVTGKGVRHARIRLGAWRGVARTGMILFIGASTVIPATGLAIVSVQKFWSAKYSWEQLSGDAWLRLFTDDYTGLAIWNSVQLAFMGTAIILVIALTISILKARYPGGIGGFFGMISKVPSGVSNLIIATGLVLGFAGAPFFLSGTLLILLIGYVVMHLPPAAVMMESAVSQIDDELIEASQSSGAGETRTARLITLPLVLPGIFSASILLFVILAGDLTGSVILAATATPTAGMLLYTMFESGNYPDIAAFGLLMSMVFSVVVLSAVYISRRRAFK